MSDTQSQSDQDVIELLTQQHQQIKALFARTLAAAGDEREQAFFELRRLLAVHEVAEQVVVRPKTRDVVPGGGAIMDALMQEEQEATEALAALEDMDVDSEEFTRHLTALQADVVEHAENEEHKEFPGLAQNLDRQERQRMASMVRAAEKMAPTRPHPAAKGRAAKLIGGPFAAMMDRARDAMAKAG